MVNCSDFSQCRAYQFYFDSREALYIDHNGQRVLADVEGEGSFSVREVPGQTNLWVDGVAKADCSKPFHESLIIVSSDGGRSEISALRGEYEPGGVREVTNSFEGCGWIISSEKVASVDGITDGWSGMEQLQPIPVFREAAGVGLLVERLPMRCDVLAELRMDEPQSLKTYGWAVKNASKLFSLQSVLPGFGPLSGQVLSHLNKGEFSFLKPKGCGGIVVRRLYDAFHGRQRARVLYEGRSVGWGFEPYEDRKQRWRWGHFGFGCDTAEAQVEIAIDPAAGTPLWSVSRYEVLALFPSK